LQKKLYFKNLDASRFIAFLLVFLAHCFISEDAEVKNSDSFMAVYNWGKIGVLGLEYFFVLSSFLISIIILEEKKQRNSFHLGNFLIRRILRVWTLYFLVIIIGVVAISSGKLLNIPVSPLPPWPYLVLFVINFYIIEFGTEFLFFIAILWSISVEEQFYLIWSLFMKFLKLRFDLFCWILIVISIVFRLYYLNDSASLYFNTISTLGNFGIGGLLAWAIHNKSKLIAKIAAIPAKAVLLLYVVLVLSIVFYHQLIDIPVFQLFSRCYYSVLFAFLILDQVEGQNRIFNMGKFKLINYLGKISYGLYCFHGIVVTIIILLLRQSPFEESLIMSLFVLPTIIFILSVLLSHLSYRYFEQYFLRLKERFYTFKP
jgi:peptidoglycan/LPS O-acetylase OafA/YrhL